MNPKDVEVKARVSKKTRRALERIAEKKEESLSVVVREALGEYLAKRQLPNADYGTQKKAQK